MERARAWVLNFDADDELAAASSVATAYTPRRAILARFEALAARVSALLGPGDQVIVPGNDGGSARRAGLCPHTPGNDPLPQRPFVGRAWCPTPRALKAFHEAGVAPPAAPPLDVLRRVNHRRFAAELGRLLPGARFVNTVDDVLETIAGPSPSGQWLLKRAFGFAGRGRRRVEAGVLDPAARSWIEASIEEGLMVEPWVVRATDAALHGFLTASGQLTLGEPTAQSIATSGAWLGSARAGPLDLTPDERRALFDAAEAAAGALVCAGYFGPFGIDAFRFLDAHGAPRFHSCCEINARYSMGWVIGMGDRRPDL